MKAKFVTVRLPIMLHARKRVIYREYTGIDLLHCIRQAENDIKGTVIAACACCDKPLPRVPPMTAEPRCAACYNAEVCGRAA